MAAGVKQVGRGYRPPVAVPTADPWNAHQWYTGVDVPDPVTFVTGSEWLNRSHIYPRQLTLIKIIFLRDDLFTQYDHDVIAEWIEDFKNTGNNGIQPDIYERIAICKARGHKWFREVLAVMGRRAGKGYIGALCMAYILWNYLAKGDPQGFYGVDRSKKLTALIFAGKRDQAKQNLWLDLVNVIIEAPCFTQYVSKPQAERLTVYAPHDFIRMRQQINRGIYSEMDMATFEILPKESTLMAGRGPASFMQGYDEMAHVVASGANRSAEEVYGAATPSLDQFGKDGFIYEPSSPWQMLGQFYENYQNSLKQKEDGTPSFPTMLMIQLTSWDIYKDWERAHILPMFPWEGSPPICTTLKGAVQVYDEAMQEVEAANPETFAVERRSHFAAAMDAYLSAKKIEEMFEPWLGRLEANGPPQLEMQHTGLLIRAYKAHGDPSLSNANFGFAIAHTETDAEGRIHAVFDYITHWRPRDYEDNMIDYDDIEEKVWDLICRFKPDEVTFDQWNSASTIQRLQKRVREAGLPKRVVIFEKTANAAYNFARAENFKTALNMGWVHAPYYEQAELELKFLQLKNGKVDKPDAGPIQTKDVADCMMECVMHLVGEQVNNFMQNSLGTMRPSGSVQGGADPFPQTRNDPIEALRGFSRARGQRPDSTRMPGRSRNTRHRH